MSDIGKFLEVARKRVLIDNRTHAALEGLRVELSGGAVTESARSAMTMEAAPQAESEAPRFVRGFHDILITVGIVIALGGLWSLAGVIAVLPAIIVLAEYFVKQQRLALPAFTLTVMTLLAVSTLVSGMIRGNETLDGLLVFIALTAALAAFYWRYRVPVALASLIAAGFGVVFFLILAAFGSDPESVFSTYPRMIGGIALVLGAGMFAVAMGYDLSDPRRVTRRSDVAFWLHLSTAPMLLYAVFFVLFGEEGFWWADKPQIGEALIAILILTVMILVGIVIDRRAFVTSGLLSLGAALGIITQESGVDISSVTAFAFLAVGVIVLLLGAGWQSLRAQVVGMLPATLQAKLPPVSK